MNTYEVTLHRVVEHETIYSVVASNEEYWTIDANFPKFKASLFRYKTEDIKLHNEEEAEELVLCGNYDEIVHDVEEGEIEDPDVINIEQS